MLLHLNIFDAFAKRESPQAFLAALALMTQDCSNACMGSARPCYTANQLVQFEAQLVALIHFRVCLVGVLLVAFKPVCPV